MRSTAVATSLAVFFSSAALTVVSAGPASAASVVVGSPAGIVVNDTLKRVFVGDDTNDRIVAADYNGNRVDSVDGIDGIFDLALSDDGTTLYAAARVSHEIVALDAATLDVKARYPVAAGIGPIHLEHAGGKVWFTYGEYGGQTESDLGSVDPAVDPASGTDPVTLGRLPLENHGVSSTAYLDTDPSQPGLLAVGATDFYDSTKDMLAVVDVSGDAPRLVASHDDSYSVQYIGEDIDLAPGTPQVLVDGMDRHAFADGRFTAAGSYPSGRTADIAPNGLVAQVAPIGEYKVAVYAPGATTPIRTYTADASDLAWAPDASRLFVLASSPGGYTLKVLTDPARSVPTLSMNAPATATRAKPLTVTGKITATVPFAAGTQLAVTRTDLESPNGKALPAITVKADGTYSFSDTPPAGGKVKYTVTYAGDAAHTATTASDTVEVSRNSTSLSLNNNGKLYNYGTDVKFTAHLGTTYKNRTVEIWADPFGGDKPKKLIRTGRVDSRGNIAALVDMTRDTTVTAVFKGDARYLPKTVKSTAYARVKISTAVARHYKTAKIGSTLYYWFHKNTDPLLTTTMTYYPGRQQRFDLQVYYQGTWYPAGSEYFPLGTSGKSAITLEGPGESGIRARMRSVYVNGSSGDAVNSTTYGPWKYLYFSR
ncbi:Ig-like domain repeat protein [Streptomyces spinoverrucosus]|uniref:YncE family protein n=1 Tax=Streptomyces spinoverrucosus TaxID=284043 RepID=UPI0018C3B9D3|nr:Ig-like domain repeat protein [Streptomyces spinoverrucosus]MBG0853799.1 Ig-like domain repeat protein [Streptomyces spinoverrucosus]